MRTLIASVVSGLVLSALFAAPARASELPPEGGGEASTPSPNVGAAEQPWRPHASYDLGVLSFGGLGAHAGVARGPWTAELGVYRFESKNLFGGALGGFDEEFRLHVDYIVAAQLGYFFNGAENEGWYGKLVYQAKQQTVTVIESGAEKALFSQLVGPEVGYEWDFFAGLVLRPRLGVLFYAQSPQPGRKPVNVGGLSYDNPTHTWIDAYITVDLGYEFDL
jgi:hypothetical protein